MATREYTVPVGTDLVDAQGNGWQVGGISIDNPSGSWLHVGGAVNAFVPPYTLGWSTPVIPSQWNVAVGFVDSPSGTVSELVGDAVTVRLHDTPVPTSGGYASGAQAQRPESGVNLKATIQLQGNEAGFVISFGIATPADQRIVPTGFEAVALSMSSVDRLRGMARIVLITVFGVELAYLAISPETPTDRITFPSNAFDIFIGAGNDLRFGITTQQGTGSALLAVTLQYYFVKV